jgi:hypothetical protein
VIDTLIFGMILFPITEAVNSLKCFVNEQFINLLTHRPIR